MLTSATTMRAARIDRYGATSVLAFRDVPVHDRRRRHARARRGAALDPALAETSFDAQQRAAADVAELRSRTTSIEQILRTVE